MPQQQKLFNLSKDLHWCLDMYIVSSVQQGVCSLTWWRPVCQEYIVIN